MESSIRGLYESLITEALDARLRDQESSLEVRREELRPADAADRLAFHLERLIRRALSSVGEQQRAAVGVELARQIVAHIDSAVSGSPLAGEAPIAPGAVLHALLGRRPDGTEEPIPEPLIPLLDTALLTNAPGEPRVGSQILAEIPSADRIDVVMAFVRWTGLVPLLDALRRHCERGATFRILTTTYTGSTEARALDELRRIGAEIRVSYDTSTTRLHAKAWLFHRSSGFSTAYIGSSNLTHSAQISGLEWNVRVSGPRNPDVVNKVAAVFESYWNSGDFEPYEREIFVQRTERSATGAPEVVLSPVELRLEPFQERLLEQVELARQQGHHRNLLVSATGTGKTVMAAVDYARLRERLARSRLLFVAHRKEILTQSLATFRHALRDASFGELWVGGQRPERFEHVFASIQSLNAADLGHVGPDHFDVVIVDEFHHAAAPSYDRLLTHLRPRELLGLTATPERSDGLSLLHWFDERIAAELRLWDAIDQHRLTPFVYYGMSDGLDLREVPWRRGRGYDVEGLEKLYTGNDAWARLVIAQLRRRIDSLSGMRALGFCVSIAHARFMARVFREAGIAATAIWADTPSSDRRAALDNLSSRRINILFSVDLFNEGVDLPAVDTLLLLRPTDSPTLFLQQLGRGLRRSPGKTVCTVLDFVGQHRKEFRFDRRFRALLGGTRRELAEQVERGFPFLPAGCHLELDPVAREEVLRSIRTGVSAQWTAKVEELRQLVRTGEVTLTRYLQETGLELEDVYAGSNTWSDLQHRAGVSLLPEGPHEAILRRACGRLLHVNDLARIETWRTMLASERPPDVDHLAVREQRLLRMLVGSVCAGSAFSKSMTLAEGANLLWAHPQVRADLVELLDVLSTRVDHLHHPLATPEVPLKVHARYSRVEILAAFGVGDTAKVASWQTGVRWVEQARADLLAFTLDKTRGQFSPTTRYRDYAVSRELIHWESQSTTRADGDTGRRYRNHVRMGTAIMLFARLRTDDRAFWFLGPARYVHHEGELPMAITWRLEHPLPGDLFATFAAAVV